MKYPSETIENSINEISKLPGIGKKTALRLSLHILKKEKEYSKSLADSIIDLKEKTMFCKECHVISDKELCRNCDDENISIQKNKICVVEDTPDVIAIQNAGGTETIAAFNANGACELYYDNNKKLETDSQGIVVTGAIFGSGKLDLPDNAKLMLGTGDDLQIWYDGSHTYIRNYNSGQLNIGTENGNHLVFRANGSDRWRINTSGHFVPGADNTYDLGTSSLRWRDIYTGDLHLSNETKGANNVDGTWGDWTLQEGESDVFMINNRSGKKFKIKMEEVN